MLATTFGLSAIYFGLYEEKDVEDDYVYKWDATMCGLSCLLYVAVYMADEKNFLESMYVYRPEILTAMAGSSFYFLFDVVYYSAHKDLFVESGSDHLFNWFIALSCVGLSNIHLLH